MQVETKAFLTAVFSWDVNHSSRSSKESILRWLFEKFTPITMHLHPWKGLFLPAIKRYHSFVISLYMFKDRVEAGEKLAARLKEYRRKAVVLAIPRGGLQVGRAIADELNIPLDCLFSKKIPLPFEEEVAIGAVSLGSVIVDQDAVAMYGVDVNYVESKKRELITAIKQLDSEYHDNFQRIDVQGKTVILTDDGIATGETIEAAIIYLRAKKVKKIVLAVPVAPPEVWEKMARKVDKAICLLLPPFFQAIGQFYKSFPQLSHEEARKLLETQLFYNDSKHKRKQDN